MGHAALIERSALDAMESRWQSLGYTLVRQPSAEQVPAFLRGFLPDAIATGQKPGLVIEVIDPRTRSIRTKLSQLRSLFSGQDDWRLEVVYAPSDATEVDPAPSKDIDSALLEAARLARHEPRSALLLAWACLEAIARSLHPELTSQGLSSSSLLDLLISNGDLTQASGDELKTLARMRNALAHGQLDMLPQPTQVLHLVDLARSLCR